MDPVQHEPPLRPQPGSQIDPRDAVGRARTTARAKRELTDGNNLLLNDPRRMGKTVWLDLFCADAGVGLIAVKIDYEGVQTTEEFLMRTVQGLSALRSLPGKARDKFRALFENIDISAPLGPITIKPSVAARSRTELLADTIRSVDQHLDDGTALVIAMDEVPIAIGNVARVEGADAAGLLLQTLRELRRRDSKLRWIVCGSIGFHHILRSCNTTEGAVNDLVNLPLGPLEADEASELARRLLLGIERPGGEDVVDAMVEHAGAIPFLIHALAHRLDDAGSGPVEVGHVVGAFMDLLDDRDESKALTHLVTRLEPFYGNRASAAETLLDRVALEHSVATTDLKPDADAALIDDLIDDHYLVEHRGVVTWRYEVLRRIWVHRRRLS
jgi:hypothetical protein